MPSEELQARVGPAPAFHDVALTTMGRLNMAGLRPDHDVLDVGCGVGRTARYLCDYLESTSRYEGFDIMEELIMWCRENITPRFPNFSFTYTPLFNTSYKPDETLASAASFAFPYPDHSFDFAFAHSVFTHLTPASTTNYLTELARVLRPGGICYMTWFLFQDRLMDSPKEMVREMTMDDSGQFAVHDPDVPDNAVAYREDFILGEIPTRGLDVVGPVHYGFARMQDVIVATKP
jgi:SAM-dependent methyltransferase